jgi:hypothetical protein
VVKSLVGKNQELPGLLVLWYKADDDPVQRRLCCMLLLHRLFGDANPATSSHGVKHVQVQVEGSQAPDTLKDCMLQRRRENNSGKASLLLARTRSQHLKSSEVLGRLERVAVGLVNCMKYLHDNNIRLF